mmetsp:Transcript_24590/g.70717  ORF Transcript_24590/g.70717 Transcript_24590/m.70717 type:complete len:181 (-) Transcript_24590:11-553(-)
MLPGRQGPVMRWCPSVRGPLATQVLNRLRYMKFCIMGLYACGSVRVGSCLFCKDETKQSHTPSFFDETGDILSALSGTILLWELGAMTCHCLRCFRRQDEARSASAIRGGHGDISLCCLPPFFIVGIGSFFKTASDGKLAMTLDAGTRCISERPCPCPTLSVAMPWLLALSALLQVAVLQ